MKELKRLKKRLSQKEEAIRKIKRLYPHLKILKDDILLQYLGLISYDSLIEFSRELGACDTDKSRQKESKKEHICYCCNREGMPKVLYRYKMEAQRAKKFISSQEGIELKIYPCPTSNGWHLARV